jgi:hypothetical protein
MTSFTGAAEPLTRKGFLAVVNDLGVKVPELMAVLAVESKSCGFLADRRPKILFERHWFHKFTGGRFSAQHPDISNPQPGGYAGDAQEYPRLEKALKLDRAAALRSTSWGAGQIMGFNHEAAGAADVDSLVASMQASEDAQLVSVANFLKTNRLVRYLKSHDWASLARAYNGSAYAKNKYDVRLAGAYQQYAAGALPDLPIRTAQLYLTYLGYAPGSIDGLHGKRSRSAVAAFRESCAMPAGDRVDKALLESLEQRVRALPSR